MFKLSACKNCKQSFNYYIVRSRDNVKTIALCIFVICEYNLSAFITANIVSDMRYVTISLRS